MSRPRQSDEVERFVAAVTQVVAENGYRSTSVEAIVDRAGLSRESFDRHFSGKEECFLVAWDIANREYVGRAVSAYATGGSWRAGMRAVADAILTYLLELPDESRLLLEARSAGPVARARLQTSMDAFVELVDQGRQELDDPDSLSRATAEGIGGAVFEQVTRLMIREDADDDLPDLAPQLMFMVFQPYLGIEEATKELRELEPRLGRDR